MAEQTFLEPLHGNEVVEAILDKLRRRLLADCYLNPNSAYDFFKANITLDLTMHDAGVEVTVAANVDVMVGQEPHEDTMVEQVTAQYEIEPAPPNVVREETGQPIPVLTTAADGKKEVRRVGYARPSAKKAARAALVLLALVGSLHATAFAQTAQPSPTATPAIKQGQENLPRPQPRRQATPAPTATNPEALTTSQNIAVEALVKDNQDIQRDLATSQQRLQQNVSRMQALKAEIDTSHPGHHFDMQSATLQRDATPTPAATATPAASAPPQK